MEVNGNLRFANDLVDVKYISCLLQGQALELSGKIQGYGIDAPGSFSVRTAPGKLIDIPPGRQFMAWLPEDVRKAIQEQDPNAIADTLQRKLEAIRCYHSQFDEQRFDRLSHYVTSMAGAEGGQAGYRYGELYCLPRPVGVKDMIVMLGAWEIPPPFSPYSSG